MPEIVCHEVKNPSGFTLIPKSQADWAKQPSQGAIVYYDECGRVARIEWPNQKTGG